MNLASRTYKVFKFRLILELHSGSNKASFDHFSTHTDLPGRPACFTSIAREQPVEADIGVAFWELTRRLHMHSLAMQPQYQA